MNAGAVGKREKSPISAASEKAATVAMPRTAESLDTTGRHPSVAASPAMAASSRSRRCSQATTCCRYSDSTSRSAASGRSIARSHSRWALVQADFPW